jgi:quinol monooxygenase YgiN
MIVRRITYTAKPGTDIIAWIKDNCQTMRAVKGMRKVDFVRSKDSPDDWGAFMYFNKMKDLEKYKETGPYKDLVKSLSEVTDMTKPIKDELFECLEI